MDIFSHTLYWICLFINPTHPVFLQNLSIQVVLLTSVLPETTALSTFSNSCSSVWQTPTDHSAQRWWAQQWPGVWHRQRARVGQLCQALPPSMELSSGTKYSTEKTQKSSPPFFFLVATLKIRIVIHWIYYSYYQTLKTLQFCSIYNTPFLSVYNFQVADHVIIALRCTTFSDFDSTFSACVTHTQSSIWLCISL